MTPGSAGRWGVGRKRKERVDAEVRAALAEFAAAVEVRVHAELERSRQTQVALIDAVRGLQAELDNRDQALAHALERIGQAIDHSSETIDAQRVERRELVETVGKLTRALPPPAPTVDAIAPRILPREHLVGGSVFGATDPVVTVDIDLVAEERRDEREAEADGERDERHRDPTDRPRRGAVPHRRPVDRRVRGVRDHPGRRPAALPPAPPLRRRRDAGAVRRTRRPPQDCRRGTALLHARSPWSRS